MVINILYLIDRMGLGGTEKQLAALIRGLDRRKVAPHLCTFRPSISHFDELDIPKLQLNVRRLVHPGTVAALRSVIGFCRSHSIDLIQTFFQDPTIFGAMVKRFIPTSLIGSFRDMGFWRTSTESLKMRLAYPMFDGFIANSHAVKEHFCSHDQLRPQQIDVIYNGIPVLPETRIDHSKSVFDGFNIGIVGNFNRPVKRMQDFIKASAIVLRAIPNTRFTLVGGGYQEESLRRMALDLGTAENTQFVGRVEDALSYISAFDVGVNTSATEGFSNAIIEYMAAGLPVVATDVGGNRELVAPHVNGFLYPVGNYHIAADMIIRLLSDPLLRRHMGDANRRKVISEFSYEKMIQSYQAYYEKIVSATT